MKNLKNYGYLLVFIFCFAESHSTPAAFTVQIINDDVELHPKYGKVIVEIETHQAERLAERYSINISGWPKKGTSWSVTLPDFKNPYTSVSYRIQFDNGDRLSEEGGIVTEQRWSIGRLGDFSVMLEKHSQLGKISSILSSGIRPWDPEKRQDLELKKMNTVSYITSFGDSA